MLLIEKKILEKNFLGSIFQKKKIGIWHGLKLNKIKKLRKIKVYNKDKIEGIKNLKTIGYYVTKKNDKNYHKIIKSFQRRFRQEMVDGIMDLECLIIAKNLAKFYK